METSHRISPNLLLLLWLPLAACVSGPAVDNPRESSDPGDVQIGDFAASEGLSAEFDPVRGRWLLTNSDTRVLIYAGRGIATVNGHSVSGIEPSRGPGAEGRIARADAERIRSALRESARAATIRASVVPSPAARAAAESAARATTPPAAGPPEPFPGVKVSLTRVWKYVILHHSATAEGNAAVFDAFHREKRGFDGLAYHFVIGNGRGSGDGEVEVGYRWTRQVEGAHAGRPPDGSNRMNESGIGICLVGDFNRSVPTKAQKDSLRRLLAWLLAACSIPPENVLLHRDIRGTDCPGRRFPAAEFRGGALKSGR